MEELADVEVLGIAYCVGSIDIKPFKLTKSSDFVSSYVLNLVAVTEIIRNFENNLKRNNASVVLFSTVAAKKGFVNHSIISSAKSGVEGLTVALAAEFAPNIRVNCIAPSLTKSKISNFLFENKKNHHLCLNCLFPNKNDIDLPRCDTVGVSGIAAGMAGLLSAQKTINFLINLNQESNILSLLNVLKQDLQNINLKNNSKCYLNKS